MTQGQGILLGSGGHALVVLHLARAIGLPITAVSDPGLIGKGIKEWQGLSYLGGDDDLPPADCFNGIGMMPGSEIRAKVQRKLTAKGARFPALTHPVAWVSPDANLGDGAQIMAGAIIQPGCTVGAGTIVNTRASLDHDARIGAFCHIAPGATLCGNVTLGDNVFIGAGATIIQGISIGTGAVVAAGAVVVQDVPAGVTTFGRYGTQA